MDELTQAAKLIEAAIAKLKAEGQTFYAKYDNLATRDSKDNLRGNIRVDASYDIAQTLNTLTKQNEVLSRLLKN